MTDQAHISVAYQVFSKEAPAQHEAWLGGVQGLATASALDPKTEALAYVAVLAAARLESGLPFHVSRAKTLGASRQEVIGAVLLGLPAVGNNVIQSLPIAVDAYDADM